MPLPDGCVHHVSRLAVALAQHGTFESSTNLLHHRSFSLAIVRQQEVIRQADLNLVSTHNADFSLRIVFMCMDWNQANAIYLELVSDPQSLASSSDIAEMHLPKGAHGLQGVVW